MNRRRRPNIEVLEWRLLLASDWQNDWRPRDVNRDGDVTTLDVLVGINWLNENQPGSPLPLREIDSAEPFYDVDGDGRHSPLDILVVINSLNGGLFVDANLKNDTGLGPSANTDRLTNDPSLRGHASGEPSLLRVRIGDASSWQDITGQLHANGSFEIDGELLEQLVGHKLNDGDLQIDFEVRDSATSNVIPDRTRLNFRLDRTRPSTNFLTEIKMDRQDRIVIPLSEPASPESLDVAQIGLFDVSFGEKSTDTLWGSDGILPRFTRQPRSVSLSQDGKSIIIVPPVHSDSIRYLVELSDVVQDRAGNGFEFDSYFDENNQYVSWRVRANYFSPDVPTLQLGNVYNNKAFFDPKNYEYKLDLPNSESLLFSGDQNFSRITRFEFYDDQGVLVRTLWPRTNYPVGPGYTPPIIPRDLDDVFGPAFKPTVVSLPAGSYRIRLVGPPGHAAWFRFDRLGEFPPLPSDRGVVVEDSRIFPYEAYELNLVAGERLLIESLGTRPAVHAVIGPLDHRVALLSENESMVQYFDAPMTGRYTIATDRVRFRSYRTTPISRTLDLTSGQYEGQVDVPGGVETLTWSADPSQYYLMRITADPSLVISSEVYARLRDGRSLVTSKEQVTFTLSRVVGGTRPAKYQIEFVPIPPASPISLNTWIPMNASGPLEVFEIPNDGRRYRIESTNSNQFELILNRRIEDITRLDPRYFESREEPQSPTLLLVHPGDGDSWRVVASETIERTLSFGEPDIVPIKTGLERFEFKFTAERGELINIASFGFGADWQRVVDPSGLRVAASSDTSGTLFHVDMTGDYRFIVDYLRFQPSIEAKIEISRSSMWPSIDLGTPKTIEPKSERAYALPMGLERILIDNPEFLRTSIFDEFGSRVVDGVGQPNDPSMVLSPTKKYFISVANIFTESRAFRLLAPVHRVESLPLGLEYQGILSNKWDNISLQVELKRGQRVRWKTLEGSVVFEDMASNLFGDRRPEPSWLVTQSGLYTLRVTNITSTPKPFRVEIVEEPNDTTSVLGRGLQGFDVIREGVIRPNAGNTEFHEYVFVAEANSLIYLDTLLNDSRIYGVVQSDVSHFEQSFSLGTDSGVIRLEDGGTYRLKLFLLEDAIEPGQFKFWIRDLSTAPNIQLNESTPATWNDKNESLIYRLDLAKATDIVNSNGMQRQFVSLATNGIAENRSEGYLTCAAGTVWVFVSPTAPEAALGAVMIRSRELVTPLPFGSSARVLLEPGTNVFSFRPSGYPDWATVESSHAIESIRLVDWQGNTISPNSAGRYWLDWSSNYRLELTRSMDSPSEFATIRVSEVNEVLERQYAVGQVVDDVTDDSYMIQYEFEVVNPGWFYVNMRTSLSLRRADGGPILVNRQSDGQLRQLQYLHAGRYVLEPTFQRGSSPIRFALMPFDSLPLLSYGRHSGRLNDGELNLAFRIDVGDEYSIESASDSKANIYVERGDSLLAHIPRNRPALVEIAKYANENDAFYDFVFARIPDPLTISLAVGQQMTVSLQSHQMLRTTFSISNAQRYYIESNVNVGKLTYSDGRSISIGQSVSSDFGNRLFAGFVELLPGDYQLDFSGDSVRPSVSYRVLVRSLQSIPVHPLPLLDDVALNEVVQLEVPERGIYRFQATNSDGSLIPLGNIVLWNASGDRIQLFEVYSRLEKGRYRMRINGTANADVQVRVDIRPSATAYDVIEGIVGETLTVNRVAGNPPIVVRFSVTPGMRLTLGAVQLAYRLIENSHATEIADEFGFLEPEGILTVLRDGTLELLVKEDKSFQLIDLRTVPIVSIDAWNTIKKRTGQLDCFARIQLAPNQVYRTQPMESASRTQVWGIIDSLGRFGAGIDREKFFTADSAGELYVWVSFSKLDAHLEEDYRFFIETVL